MDRTTPRHATRSPGPDGKLHAGAPPRPPPWPPPSSPKPCITARGRPRNPPRAPGAALCRSVPRFCSISIIAPPPRRSPPQPSPPPLPRSSRTPPRAAQRRDCGQSQTPLYPVTTGLQAAMHEVDGSSERPARGQRAPPTGKREGAWESPPLTHSLPLPPPRTLASRRLERAPGRPSRARPRARPRSTTASRRTVDVCRPKLGSQGASRGRVRVGPRLDGSTQTSTEALGRLENRSTRSRAGNERRVSLQ